MTATFSIPDWLREGENVAYVYHRPAVEGHQTDWPKWVPVDLKNSFRSIGIDRLWKHQRDAAEIIRNGDHLALSTPTASGKSVSYLVPIISSALSAEAGDRESGDISQHSSPLSRWGIRHEKTLYLAPTKALAHDQNRLIQSLNLTHWTAATLDGDSTAEQRSFARDNAHFIMSNPDMVHHSILPHHRRWSSFLSSLRFVVIDEAHRYCGAFGAHVACVLRRLRRLCQRYGSDPIFICLSATIRNPGEHAACLIGESEPIKQICEDSSSHPATTICLLHPDPEDVHQATTITSRLIERGMTTLTFVQSRYQAELCTQALSRQLGDAYPVASYRSGYLARRRRELESDLRDRRLCALISTNALELGIDISGLDAVVIDGFPGRLSSFWQQAGRAGRSHREGLVICIARDNPLDAHLIAHPELIFNEPIESTVLDPTNPYILGPHLTAAAHEDHLTRDDERWFGSSLLSLADDLASQQILKARSSGWWWTHRNRAADFIDLRGSEGDPIEIIDHRSAEVIGTVDRSRADRTVHDSAIYLHDSSQWKVERYLPEESIAFVSPCSVPYYTQAQVESDISIVSTIDTRLCGSSMVSWGEVDLSTHVTSYLRRDQITQEVWDRSSLDLPRRDLPTQAMWWTIPADLLISLEENDSDINASLHALEHTITALLPAFIPCDIWDLGSISTSSHRDTSMATIFIYDSIRGGGGWTRRGFEIASPLLTAVHSRLSQCSCDCGCPRCILSSTCTNPRQEISKSGALELVSVILKKIPLS